MKMNIFRKIDTFIQSRLIFVRFFNIRMKISILIIVITNYNQPRTVMRKNKFKLKKNKIKTEEEFNEFKINLIYYYK